MNEPGVPSGALRDAGFTLARRAAAWNAPEGWQRVVTVDAHAAGEALRVILDGFPQPRGETVLEWRRDAKERLDHLRRALMWEPRGHADMYGCVVLPPAGPRADISVLFMHNEGFSTMCGHGIIAVTTALFQTGALDAREPRSLLSIDTPAGFVEAWATIRKGVVEGVSFVNVPSFVLGLDREVRVGDVGPVRYDLAFGGAFYAYVDADAFGLKLLPDETSELIRLGRRIKEAVQIADPPRHPLHDDLGFVYGTIFVGPAHEGGAHSRNVCVFADGEVDRSPTGTGVSGRLAIHHARGELEEGQEMVVESILGTTFRGRVLGTGRVGEVKAVVPEITGRAHLTGRHEFLIDPEDPLKAGFLLR